MPEYKIYFKTKNRGTVCVEAENEQEAMKIVQEKQMQPDEIFVGGSTEILKVEEVKDEPPPTS